MGMFRANLDAVAARLSTRGFALPVEQFRELDSRRRAAITETEELRRDQNALSREIGQLRKDGADTAGLQARSREIGDRISALAAAAEQVDTEYRELMAGVPNIPHDSVPVGKSSDDNVVIRTWGEPRKFDFEPLGPLGSRP